jgi:hypothetical protein
LHAGWRLGEGTAAGQLPADRGYDTSEIIKNARQRGTGVVIPPRKNRLDQREYDRHGHSL